MPVMPSIARVVLPNYTNEEAAYALGLGGGFYHRQFQEIVPSDPWLVNRILNCTRSYLYQKIGDIFPQWSGLEIGFNTAKDYNHLQKDAKAVAPKFIENIKIISKNSGAEPYFGPGDCFALKKAGSLKRKIIQYSRLRRISVEQATQQIGDALRGTIIVDHEEQIQDLIRKVNEWVSQEEGNVVWKNGFLEGRDDGYVGIHGKILLPFIGPKRERREVQCELQVHFRSILYGSMDCRKERMHNLYKSEDKSSSVTKSISQLTFLSGMASIGNICKVPEKLKELCQNTAPFAKNLCKNLSHPLAVACNGNLGLPRNKLPQESGQVRSNFLAEQEKQGIKVERKYIPAKQLTPTQNEINQEEVEYLINASKQKVFNPGEKEILVSAKNDDGKIYVINGNHRFVACYALGLDMKVVAIDKDVHTLLDELSHFPGVKYSSLEEATKHQK